MLERGITPSATVREPLAILHHEVNVMQRTWYCRRTGIRLVLYRSPVDLRHLGAIRKRLAVTGNACLVRVDHHGISDDHSELIPVMANGDYLPAFVSPELGKCESTRHLQRILVGLCQDGQGDKQRESSHCDSKLGDYSVPHMPNASVCSDCRTFSEHAFKSKRLFRVDPHTDIAAKLLDEGINLYQGIAWIFLCFVTETGQRGDRFD